MNARADSRRNFLRFKRFGRFHFFEEEIVFGIIFRLLRNLFSGLGLFTLFFSLLFSGLSLFALFFSLLFSGLSLFFLLVVARVDVGSSFVYHHHFRITPVT